MDRVKAENIREGIDGGAIFDVTANSVRTGQIMRISGNNIQSANMIDLLSTSADMTNEGKIIHINASHAQDGTMIDIKSPSLTDGKVISLTAKQLTTGKILELIDNEALTSGKLLHMKTTSSTAENPVQIDLLEMTNGTGMHVNFRDLQHGHGLLIDSGNGSSLRNDIQDKIYDGTGGSYLTEGYKSKSGTLLDIDASGLVDGRAIRVTSFNSLESGALLDIYTNTAIGCGDGAVRLTANAMETGTAMRINTNSLTTGKALHITSGTGSSMTSGHLLHVQGDSQTNGVMAEISANSMVEGTILKLTNDGSDLRGGRVLWIESNAENIREGIDGGEHLM